MKQSQSLLIAALGAACLPGLAQDSVTVYGRVDMSFSHQRRVITAGKATGESVNVLDSGGYSGSRVGFRGRENLGGGLGAFFTLEMGIQADTGALGQGGRAFGRQSFVGLEGGYGRLALGRQYTPWFETLSFADPFGNNLVGNTGNLALANSRVDNAVLYRSPTLGGFTGQALWAPGEGTSGRQRNLSATYQNGPVWISAAHGDYALATKGSFSIIGASYALGPVKLFAHVARLRGINPTIQPAPSLAPGARGASRLIGANAPVGPGTVMVSVTDLDDKRALDRDARQFAIGYLHPLSKRTALYAATARIVNRNGGTLTVNTPSYPGRGEVQSQLGITHAF